MRHIIFIFKFFILILICFSTNNLHLHAQGLFQKGYIITNQNDTIPGLIKYEDWVQSPTEINFKELNGISKLIPATAIREFGTDQIIFKSKKIGIVNIALRESYRTRPSLDSKDSVQIFLKELVSGEHASLYLYLNSVEEPHYFIETDSGFQELYYYTYYKVIDNRRYLTVIDQYRQQLRDMSRDSPEFHEALPLYQEKYLKTYIENYNRSFPSKNATRPSANEKHIFDLNINAGFDNWRENHFGIRNKPTFGIGARVSFPGKFHNRFVKANFFFTPAINVGYDSLSQQKVDLKTYEVAFGSYFGTRNLKPYIGFHYSIVGGDYRLDFVGLQAGLSYKKKLDLEIGHFANFISAITDTNLFLRPRISLHYFINVGSGCWTCNPANQH